MGSLPSPVQTSNSAFEVWRDGAGEVYAYAENLGDKYCMHLPGLASFRFSIRGDEIAAAVNGATDEDLVVDAYRRRVLPMALQVSGREVLHASAFRSAAGVIALCADSETGKSTIAYGLNSRGYGLWADDLVAFEISDRGSRTLSLPFTMRLRPAAAALFAGETTFEREPSEFFQAGDDDDFTDDTAPLAAICVLRRDDEAAPVAVRSLTSAEAFAAVLSHAWSFALQDSERKRRMINNYLELVARVPIFDIAFQPGLDKLPAILDAIEALQLAADLRP
ncbi:MAG TPA: hypothetical protein VIW64_02285 [Pyrinomonadaceae bacterium]